ncbi:phosphate acyltransferase PlsX [Tumidithrix helvetica PCC 7403]|uniref:phosphate acyltransferase PlsX n=1 Tax=Tumidithrix helvetica TaxID=3457545 RepID=UPI003C8D95F2
MRIAVDAMGGDFAPREIIEGAVFAQTKLDLDVALVGDRDAIAAYLKQHNYKESDRLTIVPAEGTIDMHEEPLEGLRKKPRSSIAVSMDLVKRKEADAVVCAGHTGAAMAAALLRLGRLPGVDRPAIGALLPTLIPHKPVLLLDVGANVDCRPKFLEQFATMGLLYSQYALGVKEPRLGLLNIGEEACKGNDLAIRVHQALQDNPHVPFAGNAEGRDVISGQFDVIICDGFMGNVLLKFAEGVGQVAMQILKEELPQGWQGKLGTFLLRPNLKKVKERMDADEYGGALLLGVAGVCVIAHGSSKANSIYNAIRVAKDAVDNQVLDRIRGQIKAQTSIPASIPSAVPDIDAPDDPPT